MAASSSSNSKSGTVLALGNGMSAKAESSSAASSSYSSDNQNKRKATPAKLSGLRFDKNISGIDSLHRGGSPDGRGRAGAGEGDKSPRPRAIVRAVRAVWRWLGAQDDSVIETALGAISLFVLLFFFLAAPFIAGWL